MQSLKNNNNNKPPEQFHRAPPPPNLSFVKSVGRTIAIDDSDTEALNDEMYLDNAVINTRTVSWNLPHMKEDLTDPRYLPESDKQLARDTYGTLS